MRRLVDDGYRVVIAFEQRAEAERAGLRPCADERDAGRTAGRGGRARASRSCRCALRRHFLIPDIKLALLTDAQVFPAPAQSRPGRRPTPWE